MDGLPLALEQAGAYIEETGSSLSEYLELFRKQHIELLNWQSQLDLDLDARKTITSTWSLSFEKVEQANYAAAELLRFFTFLHPDAIPTEIISKGASFLTPRLQEVATNPIKLHEALGELRKYSLVRSTSDTRTLTIHRLVQTVLKDKMDHESQRLWAERVINVIA